ncbi:hypothetical protein IT402_02790 [Candidatus Nomurabacteria bacterium]|nr:hypothetical protein [Candidatus Nomurabacteria bacterium]
MDHGRFSPATENLFRPPYIKVTGKQPFKAVNNPTKKDKETYGYCPRVTLFKALRKGGFQIFLHVEFSIPKLLYGNNFDEVCETDFGEICSKLSQALEVMGIKLIGGRKTIAEAGVSVVHYAKNIVLRNYDTPYRYLREFEKINVSMRLDVNKTDFRNEGHAVRYHGNKYEVIMYDKIKDLEQAGKSEKRAIEKDNYSQMTIFDLQPLKRPFEVLRLEVRFGDKRKLKSELKKVGMVFGELNFTSLFSKQIAQKILLSTVTDIEAMSPKLLLAEDATLEESFSDLCINNPGNSLRKNLALLAMRELIKQIGVRKFREITKGYSSSTWYSLNKDMGEAKLSKKSTVFTSIKNDIRSFQQVKLENYHI